MLPSSRTASSHPSVRRLGNALEATRTRRPSLVCICVHYVARNVKRVVEDFFGAGERWIATIDLRGLQAVRREEHSPRRVAPEVIARLYRWFGALIELGGLQG